MSETSLKNSLHNLDYELYSEDNSTHILSTNQIYEIGQYGPITLVLKKLPRKFSLVKIAAGNFLTFSLFIDELYNNNLF
jgi:hypothetical protein